MSDEIYYCMIARDSDMVVFEYLINKDLKQSQLRDTIDEILVKKEAEKKEMIEYMFSPEYMADLAKAQAASSTAAGEAAAAEGSGADAPAGEGAAAAEGDAAAAPGGDAPAADAPAADAPAADKKKDDDGKPI